MLLKEILSTLQSVEESTASETDELSEMVIRKFSEEQSQDTQKEMTKQKWLGKQDSNKIAHC